MTAFIIEKNSVAITMSLRSSFRILNIFSIVYLGLWYGLSGKYVVKSLDCVFTFNLSTTHNPQPKTTLNEVSEVLFVSESKHGGIAFRVAVGSDM